MALPVVRDLTAIADFEETVKPFLYQLRPLPQLVLENIGSVTGLRQLYLDTNPFVTGLAVSLFLSPIFLVAANINRNWSQIDRFWSILPTLYHIHWTLWTHLANYEIQRVDLRLVVSLLWSLRLTYNYARRGGYKIGSEDYRWEIIRNYIGQPAFFVLDVGFIALFQNVLLFLITSPTYIILLLGRLDQSITWAEHVRLGALDYICAGSIVTLIGLTWISDQQQWDYQSAKHRYLDTAKYKPSCGFTQDELQLGFRTTGFWAYSRHPNFVCEQCIWWTFYVWSALLANQPLNWTIIGPILYSAVFAGSTPITEYITASKYPEYNDYQAQCGMFLPKSLRPARVTSSKSPKKASAGSRTDSTIDKNRQDYIRAKERYDLR